MAVEAFEWGLFRSLGSPNFILPPWHCWECCPGKILCCLQSWQLLPESTHLWATKGQSLKEQHFLAVRSATRSGQNRTSWCLQSSYFFALSLGSDLTCFWSLAHFPAMMNEWGRLGVNKRTFRVREQPGPSLGQDQFLGGTYIGTWWF